MKKIILATFSVCMIAASASSQVKPSPNPGGLIIKGGINFANLTTTKSGQVDDANSLTSFHAGVVADLPLGPGLSLQPGLLLTGKGTKSTRGSTSSANFWEASSNPLYVEVPLNIVGKIPIGTKHIFIGAGPYAAAGVGGKNKVNGKILGASFNKEYDISFSDDDPTTSYEENAGFGKLKRFDYGLNALAGVDLGRVMIGANYGFGLAKLNSGASNREDEKNKHRVFSVSLGFKIM